MQLGPPVVVGEISYDLSLVEEFNAALHQSLLDLLYLFKEPVSYSLVG